MGKQEANAVIKPLPPKRPLAPFFLYKQEVYEKVKKLHPESKITELTQIIAKDWKLVSESEKKRYEQVHAASKQKYDIEKKEYEDKHGKPDKKKKKHKKDKKK